MRGRTCVAARWTAALLAVSTASFWLGLHWRERALPAHRTEWDSVAARGRDAEPRAPLAPLRAAAVDTPAEWGGVFLAPPAPDPPEPPAAAAEAAAAADPLGAAGAALLASLPRGTSVFVTFATGHMAPFAFNWVAHARAQGLQPLLIGALDNEMAVQAHAAGVPAVVLDGRAVLAASAGAQYFGTGNPAFRRMGGVKTAFVWELLSQGLHPVLTDADVVWLRDPRPYFSNGSLGDADILVSTDCIEIPNDEAGRVLAASAHAVARLRARV